MSEIISFARCVCRAKQEFTSKLPFCMLLPRFVHLQSCEGGKRAAVSPFHRQARGTARPPRTDALACKTNDRDPRSQTRGVESRKAVASSRPQTVKAQVTKSDPS